MNTTTAVAARILEALGEGMRRHAGTGLGELVNGYATPLAGIDERLQNTARGWPAAFDVGSTPDPAWIGAATGTTVPGNLTLEEQRDYVRDRASWRRGTPLAIARAAARGLAGTTGRVDLIERDGSPWALGFRVWLAEVSDDGADAVLTAAYDEKPVGLVLTTVEVVEGSTYEHMKAEHGPTYEAHAPEFDTYDDSFPNAETAKFHVPEEGTQI